MDGRAISLQHFTKHATRERAGGVDFQRFIVFDGPAAKTNIELWCGIWNGFRPSIGYFSDQNYQFHTHLKTYYTPLNFSKLSEISVHHILSMSATSSGGLN